MLSAGIIFVLLVATVNANQLGVEPAGSASKNEIKFLKEWHVYIEEYLELLISVILSWDTNIQNFLFSQHKYVTYFYQKSKAVLPLHYYTPGSKIKMASGKMYLCTQRHDQLWRYQQYDNHDYFHHFAATFNTDKRLSLNLTFNELYFSTWNMDSSTANISLFEMGSRKEAKLIISYIGYHAGFSIYPDKGSCLILTSVHFLILLIFNASFSVMDSNLVKTIHITNSSHINIFSFWHIYESHIETSSLIQIIKSHKIVLKTSHKYSHHYSVHDGPGPMSVILDPNYHLGHKAYIYSCSSFQCLLKVIYNNTEDIFVDYVAIKLKIALIKKIYSFNQLTLFGKKCNINPCLIVFHAQSGFEVNATVPYMSYKSVILYKDCRYGGLSFTVNSYGSDHNSPLCENHSSSTDVSRSYYSSNSTLTMVFYTYEPYSEINLTLHLSPTKCKPVVLSLYDVQHFCPLNGSNSHCTNYFEQITEGTSLSLSLPFLEQFSYSNIVFSISRPGCLVLQVSTKIVLAHKNRKQNEYDRNRNFELSSESIMSFGVKFDYQITGTLVHDASVQSLYYTPETLDFFSIDRTEKFCFRQLNRNNDLFVCRKHLNQSTCENSDKDFYGCKDVRHTIQALHSDKTPIVVTAITKSPLTLEKFTMDFRIFKNSESWIDVVIIKTNLDQGNRLCDLNCHILLDIIPLLQNKTVFNVKRFYNEDDNMLFLNLDVKESDKIKLGGKELEPGIKTALNFFFETLMLVTYSMPFWELYKGKVFCLAEKMNALKITLEESVGAEISGKVKVMWCYKIIT